MLKVAFLGEGGMARELSSQELQELKERLLQRRKELQEEIRRALEETGEEAYISMARRWSDASLYEELRDVNIATAAHLINELFEIETALKRIEEGIYDFCVDCGEPIGIERLRAYPTAIRCRRCQEIFERQPKRF